MNQLGRVGLSAAFNGKSVLVTGHTGFKGGWLTAWLHLLGAKVTGLALRPATQPSFFDAVDIGGQCLDLNGDVRNLEEVRSAIHKSNPDVIFHLAAQPLVRLSYEQPLDTIQTNVLGTAHVLEAVRLSGRHCAVVIVTSDKCYENREWVYGYRETEPMGGRDVYSMTKGAAELVTSSYVRSFFPPDKVSRHGIAVASVRAGNVIGGGDWSKDRLVPDFIRSLVSGESMPLRNPRSVRPWQHVLEPLGGYLQLASCLLERERASSYCSAWNFGPRPEDARSVEELVTTLVELFGRGSWADRSVPDAPHEAAVLRLCIDKAQSELGWMPKWNFRQALEKTQEWYEAHLVGGHSTRLRALTEGQIETYMEAS